MTASGPPTIGGHVKQGFEAVKDAFTENFVKRGERGGACCIYLHGEKVVDLWGGVRNSKTGEPWEEDTMVLVYSATKGLSAMVFALLHSRDLLDYEKPIADYWPEFAKSGKAAITVRQLFTHQAGLNAFHQPVDWQIVDDPPRLAHIMEDERPAFEPGLRQAYHSLSLGFYQGELLRRIDPVHRSLGQYFHDEIARPLGLDFYIRLPASLPVSRLAVLDHPNFWQLLFGLPLGLKIAASNRRSEFYRTFMVNPGTQLPRPKDTIYARNLEVPSGGGVGTARAIARAYGVFASGGKELGLKSETLALLAAPAQPAREGFYDHIMQAEIAYAYGFMKSAFAFTFGGPASYGAPGAGGALGFADPERGLGYGYVTSRMGTALIGDPRDVAIREALGGVIG